MTYFGLERRETWRRSHPGSAAANAPAQPDTLRKLDLENETAKKESTSVATYTPESERISEIQRSNKEGLALERNAASTNMVENPFAETLPAEPATPADSDAIGAKEIDNPFPMEAEGNRNSETSTNPPATASAGTFSGLAWRGELREAKHAGSTYSSLNPFIRDMWRPNKGYVLVIVTGEIEAISATPDDGWASESASVLKAMAEKDIQKGEMALLDTHQATLESLTGVHQMLGFITNETNTAGYWAGSFAAVLRVGERGRVSMVFPAPKEAKEVTVRFRGGGLATLTISGDYENVSMRPLDVGPLFRACGWMTEPGAPARKLVERLNNNAGKVGFFGWFGGNVEYSSKTPDVSEHFKLVKQLQESMLQPAPSSRDVLRLLGPPESQESKRVGITGSIVRWSYAGGALEVYFPRSDDDGKEVIGFGFNLNQGHRLEIKDSQHASSSENSDSTSPPNTRIPPDRADSAEAVLSIIQRDGSPIARYRLPANHRPEDDIAITLFVTSIDARGLRSLSKNEGGSDWQLHWGKTMDDPRCFHETIALDMANKEMGYLLRKMGKFDRFVDVPLTSPPGCHAPAWYLFGKRIKLEATVADFAIAIQGNILEPLKDSAEIETIEIDNPNPGKQAEAKDPKTPPKPVAESADANDRDLNVLQGTWRADKVYWAPGNTEASAIDGGSITIKGKQFVKKVFVGGNLTDLVATIIHVDATKSPKELDLLIRSGPGKGKTVQLVYMLNDNRFEFFWSADKAPRPNNPWYFGRSGPFSFADKGNLYQYVRDQKTNASPEARAKRSEALGRFLIDLPAMKEPRKGGRLGLAAAVAKLKENRDSRKPQTVAAYSNLFNEEYIIKRYGTPDEVVHEKWGPGGKKYRSLRYGWLKILVDDEGEIRAVRRDATESNPKNGKKSSRPPFQPPAGRGAPNKPQARDLTVPISIPEFEKILEQSGLMCSPNASIHAELGLPRTFTALRYKCWDRSQRELSADAVVYYVHLRNSDYPSDVYALCGENNTANFRLMIKVALVIHQDLRKALEDGVLGHSRTQGTSISRVGKMRIEVSQDHIAIIGTK